MGLYGGMGGCLPLLLEVHWGVSNRLQSTMDWGRISSSDRNALQGPRRGYSSIQPFRHQAFHPQSPFSSRLLNLFFKSSDLLRGDTQRSLMLGDRRVPFPELSIFPRQQLRLSLDFGTLPCLCSVGLYQGLLGLLKLLAKREAVLTRGTEILLQLGKLLGLGGGLFLRRGECLLVSFRIDEGCFSLCFEGDESDLGRDNR